MYCISVSYKKAPAEIRGRFAFDAREKEALAGTLRESGAVDGCVVLCTCNRSEVYLSGGKAAIRALQEAVASIKAVPQQELLKYLNTYSGERATAHLFKVCCGFDSMVLGEDEILGQVRDAYQAALEKKHVDYELNVLFQRAIACAKRIRTDTRISTTPLSVATLVANEVFHFPAQGIKRVMIIGITGKMGTTIAKNILAKPGIQVTGTVRSHHAVLDFAPKGDRVKLVDYRDRYQYMAEMDIVISATTSPHYTITRDELARAMAGREPDRPRLLIDVAVPLDMDPEAAKLPGVTLRDIDYFDTLSKNNEQIRLKELDRARAIMEEDLDGAVKEILFHPYIGRLAELRAAFAGRSRRACCL
ncbi:glutamyl-tRNA reductase [Enterocloster asparagiformis]|uniref:glutamyl-tRNA reductase n=1 Tax=Enterocloster asparagiformis TaxID=333367 RepID=UPI00046790D0|nr:glutamyl-tRNA reductase [Enterocloster asparagiformis]